MSDKKTYEELEHLLVECPQPLTSWRHYKTGAFYWVIGRAIQEATQEPLVLYRREDTTVVMARPLREWAEKVEWQGQLVSRFRPAEEVP